MEDNSVKLKLRIKVATYWLLVTFLLSSFIPFLALGKAMLYLTSIGTFGANFFFDLFTGLIAFLAFIFGLLSLFEILVMPIVLFARASQTSYEQLLINIKKKYNFFYVFTQWLP